MNRCKCSKSEDIFYGICGTCRTDLYKDDIVSLLTEKLNEGQMQDYELHEETVSEALKHLENKGFKVSTPSQKEQLKNANEIIALLDAKLSVAKDALRWYAVNTLVPLSAKEFDCEDRGAYNEYLSGHIADKALQDIVDLGRWESDDE